MGDLSAIEELLGGPIPVASGDRWEMQRDEVRRFRKGAGGQRQRRSDSSNGRPVTRRRYR